MQSVIVSKTPTAKIISRSCRGGGLAAQRTASLLSRTQRQQQQWKIVVCGSSGRGLFTKNNSNNDSYSYNSSTHNGWNNNSPMQMSTATTATNATTSSSNDDTTSDSGQQQQQKVTPTSAGEKGIFRRLYDRYSIKGQQHRIRMAETFYQAATRQASDPRWFGPGRISTDFRPKHALITLHLWLLNKRLIMDETDPHLAMMIQEELFDILWNDTTCRIRNQGVNELSVNRHLGKVQQYTFSHLFHYDHIYTPISTPKGTSAAAKMNPQQQPPPAPPSTSASSLETSGENDVEVDEDFHDDVVAAGNSNKDFTKQDERIKELKNLIWIHFMQRDPSKKNNDQLDRIAWYIEAQYQNIINKLPDEYYRDGRIAWIDLPDFTKMKDNRGNILPEVDDMSKPIGNDIDDDDYDKKNPMFGLPKHWHYNITLRGDVYYWNTESMESTWDKPTTEATAAPNKAEQSA